jgi:hypothetical protein
MDTRNNRPSPFFNMGKKSNASNNNNTFNFKIIHTLLIILLIIIVIYIAITVTNYYKTDCYVKKSFWWYLFDFNDSNVCTMETEPVIKRDDPVINKSSMLNENKLSELTEIFDKKEVFHISNQDYTYDQSRCKCNSYGARLATKNEVTQAYNNGANWCTYGWTEGQNAMYPVQKCYLESLKDDNGNNFLENSDKYCGKAGLNGGFFPNPSLKFGANCYGVKPKGTIVKPKSDSNCPQKSFCELNQNFQASHKLDTDEIIGFSNDKWNM